MTAIASAKLGLDKLISAYMKMSDLSYTSTTHHLLRSLKRKEKVKDVISLVGSLCK